MDFFERIAPGRLTRRAENQAGRALLEDRCTKKQFDTTRQTGLTMERKRHTIKVKTKEIR